MQNYWVLQRRPHAERCSWWTREIYKTDETGWSLDDPRAIYALHSLGGLYRDQGRLPEAGAIYQRALQRYEKTLGPGHTSTLKTVNNLSGVYMDQGRLAEAEAMYQRALQGKEKTLGPDHTLTLEVVNDLAILYRDQGQLLEAEERIGESLRPNKSIKRIKEIVVRFSKALKGPPITTELIENKTWTY